MKINLNRLSLLALTASLVGGLLGLSPEAEATEPAVPPITEAAVNPIDESWCVLKFKNTFYMDANTGCDGYELEFDASGRSKLCDGPCSYDIYIAVTDPVTEEIMEFTDITGTLLCASSRIDKANCPTANGSTVWFKMKTRCSPCTLIPDEDDEDDHDE